MRASYILLAAAVHFILLVLVSRLKGGKGDNDAFFRGNRNSPWWAVAFGMLGASLSGVSFVSVPGMVGTQDMTYLQMCMGFIPGYLLVAFVLLPLYYRLNLTSIYTYLQRRFGEVAYRTGSSFFLLSKLLGAAARLYLVCLILQRFVFADMGIPFQVTVCVLVFLIWAYTLRSGIKSIVWTDALQTFCLLAALVLMLWQLCNRMELGVADALRVVTDSPHSRWLEWDDWSSRTHFIKQFLSGAFIVVVMTGLDQDMMQKNLTCKNLRDAQKDMCSYGLLFLPINWLFMALGILLLTFAAQQGIALPSRGDDILPLCCAQGYLGLPVLVLFTVGIIAAAFSSADSALTALTTTFCVDMLDVEHRAAHPERLRRRVHTAMAVAFASCMLFINAIQSTSVLDAIYVIASYTYGPLLGLFALGLFTTCRPRACWVPVVCVCSPVLCYLLNLYTSRCLSYTFGYELLMLNALLTLMGLWLASCRRAQ